jgi:hypothetical protein
MKDLFAAIRLTRSGTQDKFFGFGFNIDDDRIWGSRGFNQNVRPEFTKNLYEHKLKALQKEIK